jgi:Ca2+-binding EF-hand superfamily protein
MGSPVINALDADGDGEISAKELENATAALKKLDTDKDGKLSAAELRPAIGRGPGGTEAMVARFMAFDTDKDGKVSKAELPERFQALMDRGDLNKDGFLDREELAKLTPPAGRGGPGGAAGRGGRGGRGQQ